MPIYQLGERKPQIHPEAYVSPDAVIIGDVRLGARASVWPGAILRGDNDPIIIGEGSNVQDGSILHTDTGHPLILEENVTIGHQVMLHGCHIEAGSLIGMQAIILNGARIGRNTLVGAGAFISEGKVIEGSCLIIGRAEVRRTLTAADLQHMQHGNLHYQERALEYRQHLRRID